ncbi:hypothetical protein VTK73DRAFT_5882 [Phialemonium thermophilum]|uniref:Cytoplasmic tRNA 2-thiolation protein 2 n=1 Tax=Phialemonium thermophilum TaxID=223376 RepID=A0ABR3XWV4_9PEZI
MDAAGMRETQFCKKCSKREATLTQRSEAVCRDCFVQYVANKCIRHVAGIGKEVRPAEGQLSRRYLVALSLGTSSSVLLHILNEYAESILAKDRREPFQLDVVYVDTSLSGPESSDEDHLRIEHVLGRYAERYPRFKVQRVPLSTAVGLRMIDWSALPVLPSGIEPAEQLRSMFQRLPSTTSQADVLRLLVRHILVAKALESSCQAVLYGHSTTALAELTLAETAKGRGFSLPWQVGDGEVPIEQYGGNADVDTQRTELGSTRHIRVHHPLRELFRKELETYAALTMPPVADIIPAAGLKAARPVVSYRDLSIEEVAKRYFQSVEENYPSVVANVVRTTAKLDRLEVADLCCICGMPLDEQGDERWRGEIGDDTAQTQRASRKSLCHGCQRSIYG